MKNDLSQINERKKITNTFNKSNAQDCFEEISKFKRNKTEIDICNKPNLDKEITTDLKIKNMKNSQNHISSRQKNIDVCRLVTNCLILIVLLIVFCYSWTAKTPQWQILFFLTLWSYWMNFYYIASITIIDFLYLVKKIKCEYYNNFVRNYFLRVSFPFAIGIVFLYWILILLGDSFEGNPKSINSICISFFMHGLVFLFLCFDIFTSVHVNKKDQTLWDLLIISIIMIVYYVLLGIGKYLILFNPYDFMKIADVRQIIGACIIIYVIIINGYIVFQIIGNYFFVNEYANINKEINNESDINKNELDFRKTFCELISSEKDLELKTFDEKFRDCNIYENIGKKKNKIMKDNSKGFGSVYKLQKSEITKSKMSLEQVN